MAKPVTYSHLAKVVLGNASLPQRFDGATIRGALRFVGRAVRLDALDGLQQYVERLFPLHARALVPGHGGVMHTRRKDHGFYRSTALHVRVQVTAPHQRITAGAGNLYIGLGVREVVVIMMINDDSTDNDRD